MKLFKLMLVALMIVMNLVVAQPSLADPVLTQSTEYTEVTQALTDLLNAKNSSDQSTYTPEELQQKIGELKLQKYILETAKHWGQCRNETGKTLAVYAHKPKKSYFPGSAENTLYYLANGQETDDDWDCDGVFLPSGTQVTGLTANAQALPEAIALKIVDGTEFIATSTPDGAIRFNVTPANIFTAADAKWDIPALAQTDIDATTPNAPIED